VVIQRLFIGYSEVVHWLFRGYLAVIERLFIGYSEVVQWLFSGYAVVVSGCMAVVHMLQRSGFSVHSCSVVCQWLYLMVVHWLFRGCSMVIQRLFIGYSEVV